MMTLAEYCLYVKAYALKKIDARRDFIEREFSKRLIKAVEQKGDKSQYVYTKVEQIFDYKKEEIKILGKADSDEDRLNRLRRIANRVRELERE